MWSYQNKATSTNGDVFGKCVWVREFVSSEDFRTDRKQHCYWDERVSQLSTQQRRPVTAHAVYLLVMAVTIVIPGEKVNTWDLQIWLHVMIKQAQCTNACKALVSVYMCLNKTVSTFLDRVNIKQHTHPNSTLYRYRYISNSLHRKFWQWSTNNNVL